MQRKQQRKREIIMDVDLFARAARRDFLKVEDRRHWHIGMVAATLSTEIIARHALELGVKDPAPVIMLIKTLIASNLIGNDKDDMLINLYTQMNLDTLQALRNCDVKALLRHLLGDNLDVTNRGKLLQFMAYKAGNLSECRFPQWIKTIPHVAPTIEKTEPGTVLLFGSTPPEKQAAKMRNKAVDSMAADDVGGVAYRYMQAKAAYERSLLLTGATALYTLVDTILSWDQILTYPVAVLPNLMGVCLFGTGASVAVTQRETKNACAEWLEKKLGTYNAAEIQSAPISREGLFKVRNDLQRDGYHVETLNRKIAKMSGH